MLDKPPRDDMVSRPRLLSWAARNARQVVDVASAAGGCHSIPHEGRITDDRFYTELRAVSATNPIEVILANLGETEPCLHILRDVVVFSLQVTLRCQYRGDNDVCNALIIRYSICARSPRSS